LLLFFFCIKLNAQQVISLAGQWNVKYGQASGAVVKLPGTLDDAGIGERPNLTDEHLTRDVLLHLTRKHSYIGPASYERMVDIPPGWSGKSITLELERVLWTSRVRVDGREAGMRESLTTPHYYELGNLLTPGRHHIVIEVDNRRQYDISIRNMAHSYTEETQIIWNGILGKIRLIARNPEHISAMQVYPIEKGIRVMTQIEGLKRGTLLLEVLDGKGHVLASRQKEATPSVVEEFALTGAREWDEFTPNLYTVRATLASGDGKDVVSTKWGMRTVGNKNSELWINGRRLFLRGTLECDIFPLTGHPPMDRPGWVKEFTVARSYGLNHLRFHSWCPPAAAFEVADSIGFYLQIELPFWNTNAGKDTAMDRWLREEAFRISREYGNHPSFCFWSMGNELEGDFEWLHGMISALRDTDPRHLYTSTSFSFQAGAGKWPEPGDDFYITQYTTKGWVRGQGIFNSYPPDFKSDYTKAVDGLPLPLIVHEMGQYSVYPDMREIAKYTGVLDPLNFKAIRRDLMRKDLLDLSPAFTRASGKFAAKLYKEEIERVLRTPGTSGFQLLDLHDFPGQGTALIGMLDAFWDSKGLVTPEQHRMYCSAVVPLIRFDKATYTNNEQFTATVEVANFGKAVIKGAVPEWTVLDGNGNHIAGGKLERQDIAMGNGHSLGSFSFGLNGIKQATRLTIIVRLKDRDDKNEWNIWVYPERLQDQNVQQSGSKEKLVFDSTLEQALGHLREGKDVLFNPDTACLNGVAGRFAPVFWSPVHFPDQPGTMGLLIRPEHPALKDFPTEAFTDWQWWDLVTNSKTMILDSLPATDPIVRVIDIFVKNRKMAEIIEARIGKGRLVLVSADIRNGLEHRPAARQLRYSLEKYMRGAAFHPGVELDATDLKRIAGCDSGTK
jgi:hypothetical protein